MTDGPLTRVRTVGVAWRDRLRALFEAPPLGAHLTIFALILLAPAVALAGLLIADFAKERRRDAAAQVVAEANEIANAVSTELNRSLTILETLSFSDALVQNDLAEFHAQASRTVNTRGDALFLVDRSGNHLMHTVEPWGGKLGTYGAPAALAKVIESKQSYITDLFVGRTRNRPVVNLLLPIVEGGEVNRVLVMSIGPERILDILRPRAMTRGWISTVADRNGRIIARSRDHDDFVGQLLPGEYVADVEGEPREVIGVAGNRVVRATAPVKEAQWTVVSAVEAAVIAQGRDKAIESATIWSTLLLGFAAVLVIFYARELSASFRTLGAAVGGQPRPTIIKEANEAADQLASMAAQLRLKQRELQLALGAARLGWWTCDTRTRHVSWDARFREVFAIAEDTGSIESLVAHIHPDDAGRVREAFAAALDGEESDPIAVECRIRKTGERDCWIEVHGIVCYPAAADARTARLIVGTVADVTERKIAEERQQLLLSEVNHRSKNLLTLVEAVARQTIASDGEGFLARFSERLQALSASQDVLVRSGWHDIDLEQLVRSQLAHFADLVGNRMTISGPPFKTSAAAAQTIGMAVHELATNAGKYGALSNEDGLVDITWGIVEGPVDKFCMSWIERGGPAVRTPSRKGFGTTVIDSVCRMNLNADVSLVYDPGGLVWRLTCPLERVFERAPERRRSRRPTARRRANGNSRRILVVEDDALTALEVAASLRGAGFAVVGPTNSVSSTLELLDRIGCDAAVLDVNLGGETSAAVAVELRRRGKPFVTISAYAPHQQPAAFADAPQVSKPFRPDRVIAALNELLLAPVA